MSDFDVAVAAMGEIEEFGSSRITLPESYFQTKILVEETGIKENELDEDTGEIIRAFSPWAQITLSVTAGPYTGAETSLRLFISPGKTGRAMGFLNNLTKVISGRPVNTQALKTYGFTFSNPKDRDAVQEDFANHFFSMSSEDRHAFILDYMNIKGWDGREFISKVGVEENTWTTNEGEERTVYRNRLLGAYALNDARKGTKYVSSLDEQHQSLLDEQMNPGS